jgi:hypothetical protein
MAKDIESWKSVLTQMEGTNRTGLSMPERELLNYVEREWKVAMRLVERANREMEAKRWFDAISAFFQLLQRANAAYSYLFQPSLLSTVNNDSVKETVNRVLGVLTDTVIGFVQELKASSKEIGLESVTLSTSAFPPTLNVSVVVKNA